MRNAVSLSILFSLCALTSCLTVDNGEADPSLSGRQPFETAEEETEIFFSYGHPSADQIIITPDNRYAVTSSVDGTLKWWDLKKGTAIKQESLSTGVNIWELKMAPDGEHFVSTVSGDKGIRLWQFSTGNEYPLLEGPVWSCDFLDNQRLVVAGGSNAVRILSIPDGKTLVRFGSKSGNSRLIVCDAQNGRVFSVDTKGAVREWDPVTGKLLMEFESKHVQGKYPSDAVLSEDGQYLSVLYGLGSKIPDMYKTGDGTRLRDAPKSWSYPTAEIVDPAGKLIIRSISTGTGNWGLLEYFSLSTGRPLGNIKPGTATIKMIKPLWGGEQFLAGLNGGSLLLIDTRSGEVLKRMDNEASSVAALFRPDGKGIITAMSDGKIRLWDPDTLTREGTLSGHISGIRQMSLSRETQLLVSTGGYVGYEQAPDDDVRLWDLDRMQQVYTLDTAAISTAISSDGRFVGYMEKDALRIWDRHSSSIVYKKNNSIEIKSGELVFSPDSRYLAEKEGDVIRIIDTENWTERKTIRTHTSGRTFDSMNTMQFSEDGNWFVFIDYFNSLVRVKVAGWKEENPIILEPAIHIMGIAVSPDGSECLISDIDNRKVLSWSLSRNAQLDVYDSISARSMVYRADSKFILIGTAQGVARLIDPANRDALNFYARGDEWIIFDDAGYFAGSTDAGEIVSITRGLENFRIDQFALILNRPDLLMEKFNADNKEAHSAFSRLFSLRKHRYPNLASDIPDWSVPKAVINNLVVEDNEARLTAEFIDDTAGITGYQVFINNVPVVFRDLSDSPVNSIRIEETLELSFGKNKVEVSCTNDRGIESYRDYTLVERAGNYIEKKLYFAGLGISRYNDPDLSLKYAEKDARDIAQVLEKTFGSRVETLVLTDDEINAETCSSIQRFLSQATIHDSVILFIAGHGMHGSNLEYYYLTAGSDRENLAETGIPYAEFESLLQSIKPREKLFLIDTCESGILDESVFLADTAVSDRMTSRGARGLSVTGYSPVKAHEILQDRNRFIFNDLARRSGSVVFSSCRGNELSYESDHLENGFFTEAFINALDLEHKKVERSFNSIRDEVTRSVTAMSGGRQNPVIDRDNIFMDFAFPWISEPKSGNSEQDAKQTAAAMDEPAASGKPVSGRRTRIVETASLAIDFLSVPEGAHVAMGQSLEARVSYDIKDFDDNEQYILTVGAAGNETVSRAQLEKIALSQPSGEQELSFRFFIDKKNVENGNALLFFSILCLTGENEYLVKCRRSIPLIMEQ